jgi:hypothetical protein
MEKAKQVSAQVRAAASSPVTALPCRLKRQQQDGVSHMDSIGSKQGSLSYTVKLSSPKTAAAVAAAAPAPAPTPAGSNSHAWLKLLLLPACICHASSECVSQQQQQQQQQQQLEHQA